jgi:hypothetical protein
MKKLTIVLALPIMLISCQGKTTDKSVENTEQTENIEEIQSSEPVSNSPKNTSVNNTEKMKSLFVYKFAQSTTWPEGVVGDTFFMGVIANKEIANILETAAIAKKIDEKPVVIQHFSSIDDFKDVHVLYCASESGVTAENLFEAIGSAPTLLVTDGYENNSTMLNLKQNDNLIQFELNKNNLEAHGLKVNAAIDELAVDVISF